MATILVIDDDYHLRMGVCDILELDGYTSVDAEDGQAGLEKAKKLLPDVIICDTWMPRLSGVGVVKGLRADPATAEIPVIYLYIGEGTAYRDKLRPLGVEIFLDKPFDAEEILAAVRTYV